MSDLYPLDATNGGDIRFPMTFDHLRRGLQTARKELAVTRCRTMLKELIKRHGDLVDGDYTP